MPPKTVAEELPSLPAGSVDFDVLQKALRDGKSGEEAVALATWQPPEPEEAAPTEAPSSPAPAAAPVDPTE